MSAAGLVSADARAALLFELSKSAYIDSGYFEIAAEHIALTATRGLAISRASVWRLASDGETLRCAARVEDDQVLPDVESQILLRKDFPRYFAAMAENQLVAAGDVRTHPVMNELWANYSEPLGIASMMDAPFRFEGGIAGLICCESRAARQWELDDERFLIALTEFAARAQAAEARQRAEDALKVASTGIEAQVAERTHALRLALAQLQKAQDQLVQNEKMAALGGLVAGVAHEINTPLGISVTAASHLREALIELKSASASGQLTRDAFETFLHASQEGVDILTRNLERAAQLVQSFKRVAVNQSDSTVSEFLLHAVLQDLLRSVSPECKRAGAICVLDCPEGIAMRGDVGALDQVMTNLVMNALRHGLQDRGGEIRVRALAADGVATVEVADNGVGIEPDLLPRIFDPFVTTRRGEGGTGLGLHIVQNLVQYRLRGRIEVSSMQGVGTTFELRLPCDADNGLPPMAEAVTEPVQIFSAALAERGRRGIGARKPKPARRV